MASTTTERRHRMNNIAEQFEKLAKSHPNGLNGLALWSATDLLKMIVENRMIKYDDAPYETIDVIRKHLEKYCEDYYLRSKPTHLPTQWN
jgi:hypothetical protein